MIRSSRQLIKAFISPKSVALLLAALFANGCGREEIKVYRVAKEHAAHPTQMQMPAGHADVAAAAAVPLRWKTPEGWKEGAPSEFRVASFLVFGEGTKRADVSVIPLPGGAGGDLGNVNRWRDQVGQPPVSAEELKTLAQPVELGDQPASLYEQSGGNANGVPTRILAAVQHRDGTAWFFKMTGDSDLVAQQKGAFIEFLKSIQFVATEAPSPLPDSHPPIGGRDVPAGHPEISPAMADGVTSAKPGDGRPTWHAPAGWKEMPGGQFLVARFVISGEGSAQAAVNVSTSTGDGGGLAANVNRWRKQLGLSELTADELAKSVKNIDASEGTLAVIEMSGTDGRTGQPAALVGAVVLRPGQAWFYKLMGDTPVVAAQKDAFLKFVQEVKY